MLQDPKPMAQQATQQSPELPKLHTAWNFAGGWRPRMRVSAQGSGASKIFVGKEITSVLYMNKYIPIPGLVCKNRSDPPLRENTPLSKKHAPFQILDFQHFWSHAWTQCKLKQIAVNHPICFSEPWFPQKNTYIHHVSIPTLHLFIPGYPATWFHRLSSRNIMIYHRISWQVSHLLKTCERSFPIKSHLSKQKEAACSPW